MIFVDTGAWIGFSDRHDRYHQEAVRIYSNLKSNRETFLSTDYVVDETVTRLKYDLDHDTATKFLDLIKKAQESRILQLVNIDELLFLDAEALFRKYDSVKLSFTDCTSFVVCKQWHVERVFAFDHHFTIMGLSLCS